MSVTNAFEFYPPRSKAILMEHYDKAVATGQPYDLELDFNTFAGQYRRVHVMGELELRDGKPVAMMGVMQDVTAKYTLEQALRRTANTDELTNLGNRACFNMAFEERMDVARRDGSPLAVLLLDLDNFKTVNDLCGHAAGDDLLRYIARKLDQPYLAECSAARLGGDEFVMIIDSPALVADLLGTIRCILADLSYEVEGPEGQIHVSATIGCALLEDDVNDTSALLKRADSALYRAKRIKRGTASIWGEAELILPGALREPSHV